MNCRMASVHVDVEVTIPGFFDLQINGWGGIDFSSGALTEAAGGSQALVTISSSN